MKEAPRRIYFDLESIFDLRQGAILSVAKDREKAIKYLVSKDYNFRDIDEFDIVDMKDYNNVYKNNPRLALKNSTISSILSKINQVIAKTYSVGQFLNEARAVELIFNTYPIEFKDEEAQVVVDAVFAKLQNKCKIELVYMPNKDLGNSFFSSYNIYSAFIYDFSSWASENLPTMSIAKNDKLVVYSCSIIKNKVKLEELKLIKKLGFSDIFSYTEFCLTQIVSVEFLPPILYSSFTTYPIWSQYLFKDLAKNKEKTNIANKEQIDKMLDKIDKDLATE